MLAILLVSGRRSAPTAVPVPTPAAEELSAADRADDELLRQASYLAGGGDEESDVPTEDRL